MMNYEECKAIAENRAKSYDININAAYQLGENYVFDNTEEEYIGVLPMVVDVNTGEIKGLWRYLNEVNLTMDDMQEIEF